MRLRGFRFFLWFLWLEDALNEGHLGLMGLRRASWVKGSGVRVCRVQLNCSGLGFGVAGSTLRLQIAQGRYNVSTLDPQAGTICILGVLGQGHGKQATSRVVIRMAPTRVLLGGWWGGKGCWGLGFRGWGM